MSTKLCVCLMLFLDFVFDNQPTRYLFVKEQSVFISNWQGETAKSNAVSLSNYFLADVANPNLTNDSIQMQKTQTNGSRITLGKITIEGFGAGCGGFLLTYIFSRVSLTIDNFDVWWILVPFICPAVGTAGGATLVGNQLMEPNGSFTKSLIGSAIGTLIGAPIAYLSLLSGGIEY